MLYQCLLHFFILLFLKCVCLCACISQRLMSSILLNCSSIFLDFIYFYFNYMGALPPCLSVYHVHAWCLWGQDRMLDSLELVLRMVVSHHIVVRVESSSSGRVLFRLVVREG